MPDTKLTDALPTDALKGSGQRLMTLLVQRAAEAATDRVSGLTDRLDGISDNGGTGVRKAFGRGSDDGDDGERDDGDRDDGDDDSGSGGGFFAGLKDKVSGLFGGGSGGGGGSGSGKKLKVTNIVEELDVGLPLRTTYDLWTQLADFPSFMKKVESVEQVSDEKTHWKAQIFLSHREWEATTLEQVPDSHIVWRSQGAKGHVDGAVAFTEIGPNMTRVLLVLEYWPQGLFERTGNIWRAQGRRARLEFKHFRRHAMASAVLRQDEIEGWRGEIRDSEVVRTHEEALEEEGRGGDDAEDRDDEAGSYDDEAGSYDDEADSYDEEPGDDEEEVDGADDSYDDAEGDYDEDDEADGADDEYDDVEEDEYDDADSVPEDRADEEPDDDADGADDEYDDYDDRSDDRSDDGADDEIDEPDDEPPARRRNARRRPATAGRSR